MQLQPVLGAIQLFFYSVGVIVGAGIYSVIGVAAGLADEGLWLSFVIAALAAVLTGLSYAEMTTTFPAAGAEYVYVQKALPRNGWAAFGVGFIILVGGAATATTVAVAFAGYLKIFVDVPEILSAGILLALCTGLNLWGLRESSWANIVFTLIEVGGLVLVVGIGLRVEGFGDAVFVPPHAGVFSAAAIIFFVYLGFEEIANLAEETRNPARDLPLALFLSILVTTVLYVLVALSVTVLASPEEMAASGAPLAAAVAKVWPQAAGVLSGIALFATANTVLITLIATSRLAFSMGRDGGLPAAVAHLLPIRKTPWVAAVLVFAMSAVLLPAGQLAFLAGLSSFAAILAFAAVNVALIVLRYRLPHEHRPFRVPIAVGRLPILPLTALAALGVLMIQFERKIYIAGAMMIAVTAIALVARPLVAKPK
ncbi:MAG: APC family permease [Xanthobacteraceae bacterium]